MSRFISSMIAGVCLSVGLVHDVQAEPDFLVLSQENYAWKCKLRVIDAASARVIAETPVGRNAEVGYDAPRSRVAVLTHGENEQTGIPSTVLTYFSVPELKEIERKRLAAPKNVLGTIFPFETCAFSPTGSEIIVQYMSSFKLRGDTTDKVRLTRFNLGKQPPFVSMMDAPRARTIQFVRTKDWPMVTIWKPHSGILATLDFSQGRRQSAVVVRDDPNYPAIGEIERIDANEEVRPYLGARGMIVTEDEITGYYIPENPHPSSRHWDVGRLRKIDLTMTPPRIVLETEHTIGLSSVVSAVSEQRGTLYAAEHRQKGNGMRLPSNVVRRFSTTDLVPAEDMVLRTNDVFDLAVSGSGTHLVAADFSNEKLCIVDLQSGDQRIMSLDDRPGCVIPLR